MRLRGRRVQRPRILRFVPPSPHGQHMLLLASGPGGMRAVADDPQIRQRSVGGAKHGREGMRRRQTAAGTRQPGPRRLGVPEPFVGEGSAFDGRPPCRDAGMHGHDAGALTVHVAAKRRIVQVHHRGGALAYERAEKTAAGDQRFGAPGHPVQLGRKPHRLDPRGRRFRALRRGGAGAQAGDDHLGAPVGHLPPDIDRIPPDAADAIRRDQDADGGQHPQAASSTRSSDGRSS